MFSINESLISNLAELSDVTAHALRVPLATVKEFTNIVRDGVDGPINAIQKKHLDLVAARVNEVAQIIDDFDDLYRIRKGTFKLLRKNCDVACILEDLRAKLHQRTNISLNITTSNDLPPVFCDPKSIARLLVNLACHVAKFIPDHNYNLHVLADPDECCIRFWLYSDDHDHVSERIDLPVMRNEGTQFETWISMSNEYDAGLDVALKLIDLNLGNLSDNPDTRGVEFSLPIADTARVASRYLLRLKNAPSEQSHVHLIAASVTEALKDTQIEQVDAFLQQTVSPSTLVLRIDNKTWLLLIQGQENDKDIILEGLCHSRKKWNQIPSTVKLPEISFVSRQALCLREISAFTNSSSPNNREIEERPKAIQILLVDDDRDIVEAAAIRLQICGYETRTAYDGEQAIQLATLHQPDAIVLDIRMPKMDGLTALQRLQQDSATSHIPVAILSASADDREKAMALGASCVIAKPYEANKLIKAVNSLVSSTSISREARLAPR